MPPLPPANVTLSALATAQRRAWRYAGVADSGEAGAAEVHVLMNNCYRDHAVRNAKELAGFLAEEAS